MEDQNLEFEYSENKIDQALKLYDTELNDEQVAKEVTTLLKKTLEGKRHEGSEAVFAEQC